jgi:[ribosomal protein S5]-alanine N-acetyltransferase
MPMPKITIRLQQVSDAKRFYEILNNPSFIYFPVKPASIKAEKEFLATNKKLQKNNTDWNFSILLGKQVIGAVGIKINRNRNYVGEIGYFIDQKYWGRGYATHATKLADTYGFEKLNLERIEILMNPKNIGSEKVAINNGYQKEGKMRNAIKDRDGKIQNAYLYAKTKIDYQKRN